MKKCVVCKTDKSLDEYYNSKQSKDGKSYRCKPCDADARRNSRSRSPNTVLGYRRRNILWKYGMTMEAYDDMLASQGHGCAICGTTNPVGEGNTTKRKSFSFAVDHCHSTGTVRGLLCNPCNRGLGFFKDSPKLLRKAIEYLDN